MFCVSPWTVPTWPYNIEKDIKRKGIYVVGWILGLKESKVGNNSHVHLTLAVNLALIIIIS